MSEANLITDLALFADLGTDPPQAASSGQETVVRMVRNGEDIELIVHPDGSLVEKVQAGETRHHNLRALFASPRFGDLGRWADAQANFLKLRVEQDRIPVRGSLNGDSAISIEELGQRFLPPKSAGSHTVRILLLDGPAGIGKTSLIRALAYKRAAHYREMRHPLLLHVESRGRMLQNLMDLMAFSLQTLRLNVTYDQIPSLVRHGLVTLAIDGFDELGDPNGYELAWAQVNELVSKIRGQGSLLLAGRETFIGRERIVSAITAFKEDTDELLACTVQPITPIDARSWLRDRGWPDAVLSQENVQPLFEPGSYALRPFFLTELSREGVSEQVQNGQIDDLTWFLVDTMIHREATKFGTDVEAVTTPEGRREFLHRFLGEVARDLAENQTEAIAAESLSWIAEVVAHEIVPGGLVGVLRNRASVVAFLTDDDRRGYRRFSHPQLQNHFLSRVTIDAIVVGEVPKYVRRNILGADFLRSFAEVAAHMPPVRCSRFAVEALQRIREVADHDRARRNLAALVLAIMNSVELPPGSMVSDVTIDEALVVETVTKLVLKNVIIVQLDARAADLRELDFIGGCHIMSLIGDAGTLLPAEFPQPNLVLLPHATLTAPEEINKWVVNAQGDRGESDSSTVISAELRDHEVFQLLGRLARHRPFWLREGESRNTRKILDDPYWESLRELLEEHDLLVTRTDVPASGGRAKFFHLKRKDDLLSERLDDERIKNFFIGLTRLAETVDEIGSP